MHVIREYIVSSEKVCFEGNNYSEEWHQEAEKRGLPNVRTTPVSLDAYVTDKAKHLFESNNVLTHVELEARHEIELEKYIKKVQIEARIMGEMATSHIVPAAIKYQNELIQNIKGLKEIGMKEESYANQKQILEKISEHVNKMADLVEAMIEARKKANAIKDTREMAIAYCDTVKDKYFDGIRYHADKLELLVSDDYWMLPKYREMLFLR
jgi:glutamine synthetase